MKAILFILLIAAVSSCSTFQRVKRKFGRMAIDSAYVKREVTVTLPKDSAVLRFQTIYDTTYVRREFQQGRAQVVYVRGPKETVVQANCLPDTIRVPVEVPCPPVVSFGVDPRWKWAAIAAGGLLAVLILAGGLLMLLSRWYTVVKK